MPSFDVFSNTTSTCVGTTKMEFHENALIFSWLFDSTGVLNGLQMN